MGFTDFQKAGSHRVVTGRCVPARAHCYLGDRRSCWLELRQIEVLYVIPWPSMPPGSAIGAGEKRRTARNTILGAGAARGITPKARLFDLSVCCSDQRSPLNRI